MVPVYSGSVYHFVVTAPETSETIMRSQSWSASRVTPDHLSWNDLYDGVYLAMLQSNSLYNYGLPEYKTIKVADAGLVDASRAKFYPTEIPGVFFKASVRYLNPPKKVPIIPEFVPVEEEEEASVNVLAANVTLISDLKMDVNFGMAFWCSLGDGVLPFYTSFTSDDGNKYSQVKVPDAPNNVFTFVATAEKRLASSVSSTPPLETISQTIKLTSGKLLIDALIQELPGQLTGLGANMISVERYVDSVYNESVQARILFSPYQPDSNTLYVPLEFTVQPTNLVAFGSATSLSQVKAVTSCPVNKGFNMEVNVQSSPNVDNDGDSIGLGDTVDCTGTMGVAEISSCSAQLVLNYTFTVKNAKEISLLGDMHNVIPDPDLFSTWYENTASLNTALNVSNFVFNVNNNKMSDLASESMIMSKKVNVPFKELKNVSAPAYNVDIPSSKPTGRALLSLMTTRKEVFCSGLRQSLDKVSNFVLSDHMKQILPFTSQHMSPIFKALINEHLEDAMKSVCAITNDHGSSIESFCNELESKFGFSICGNTTLSDEGLEIPMLIRPELAYAPVAFQFDSKRFIPDAGFSSAFGSSGDLVLDAVVAADVGLKLAFLEKNDTNGDTSYYSEAVLDPETTSFVSKVSHQSAPRVKTLLGSTLVTFDQQNLDMSIAVTGGISENSDDVETTAEGSAHMDGHAANEDETYYCQVTANVPFVEHYFHPPPNAMDDTVEFEQHCLQGDFVPSVQSSFDNMTLAKYFEQDPDSFFKQFSNGLAKSLFDYILDYVTDKAIAYVGKRIQALASKAFDKIIGPEAASKIADEITAMVAQLIKSGQYPDPQQLEAVLVTFFTASLNRVFQPILLSPIADPGPGDVITWVIQLGSDTTKELNSIDWACGEHGIADFEVKSQNQLNMHWNIDFNLVWNKTSGFSIQWPGDKPLDARITLTGNSFELSGSLLFLTADLQGTLTFLGDLSANPNNMAIGFTVSAGMQTTGQLGLVQKIRQETKGEKANALGALPYVTAGVSASWEFDWNSQSGKPTVPKSFQFTDPQLCLGSIITEFMQQVSREVNRILKPLDPIFGPDGVLQKPIPGLSKILGDHTNVLSILEWTCNMFSSSCNINTVRKLVNVLNDIAADIGKIKEFMSFMDNPQGCMDFAYLYRTFNISWNKQDPTPDDPNSGNSIIPMTPTEKFMNVPESRKSDLHNIMAKWSPANSAVIPADCVNCTEADAVIINDGNDKFGFKLDILENFPQKLIALLLGQNVAMFSVSFPEAKLSYSITWTIPVWSVPYVAVNIHAGASVSFQPPSVALMSNGIIDTVKTGNPSHLFRNLAVSTTTAFASGSFEVDGGAEGGINIVIAKVTVNFDITVKFVVEARVANFNNDDWATFDTILMQVHTYGFKGAIQLKLELRGGFKLYLKGCVNVLFWKKCWTIVSWSWDTTLWSLQPSNDKIMSLATSGGSINSASFDFSYPPNEQYSAIVPTPVNALRSYILTNSAIMFMPANIVEGNAALTRNLDSSVKVNFYSLPCTAEYNIIIDGDIKRPGVTLPSCNLAHFSIKQMGFRTVAQYTIGGSSILPDGRNVISYGPQCSSVSLDEPVYGTKYIVQGSPACSLTIDTEYGSSLNLTGSASSYKGPVTITGALDTVFAAMNCSNYNISSTKIVCDSATITIPSTVRVVKVAPVDPGDEPLPKPPHPHPKYPDPPVRLCVQDVPSHRTVQVIGATPLVDVSVPQMSNMSGIVSIDGNSEDDNYIHVEMDTPLDSDIVCTAYPSQLAYNDSDDGDRHVIRHKNVNVRSYSMRAAPGRTSTMRLITPTAYETVTVSMIGADNAVLRHELSGCDKRSNVNVTMSDVGSHTLLLGVDGTLNGVQCSLRVFTDGMTNDNNCLREIIVNASLDDRSLDWVFTDSEFYVANSYDTSDIFHVYTEGIHHVTVYLSRMNTLTVNKADKDGTEYVFVYPEDAGLNSVQITATQSPLLLQGPVQSIQIGDPLHTENPLNKIGAVVAIPPGVSNIMMDSTLTSTAVHMAISENCVYEQSAKAVPKPSDWFISAIEAVGITFTEGCNVLVPNSTSQSMGFGTTLDIYTGDGNDTLDVMNPTVSVVADMGKGDDTVNWLSPDSTASLFLMMGDGSDTLSVQSAGPVNLDLGEDRADDHVIVVCKDASPSIVHTSVFPIGLAGSEARLEISNWDSADTLEITRFSLSAPVERATAVIASDVEGVKIRYEQNDNTDYHVKTCTNNSVLAFTTAYQGFDRAKNTNIEIALESYDNECTVTIDGAEKTNGSLMFGVDSNAQTIPSELLLTTGSATFGNLNVSLSNVDHIGVAISEAFSDKGKLMIKGSPAKQDIFVNIPSWSTVVSKDVKDIAVMTAFSNAQVEEFDVDGQGMVVSLSTQEVPTELDLGGSMKEMTMTSGCVESANKRVLSDWILSQAKKAGFELAAEQNCAAVFKGLRFLMLDDCKELQSARLSGLGWTSVRSVYFSESTTHVALETTNTVTKDTLWTRATLNDHDLQIARMQDDAFHVTMRAPTGSLELASAVFAPSAQFFVNCTNSSYNYQWIFALNEDHRDKHALRNYYADVNFTSNGKTCSGRINNRIFATMDSAPKVNLAKGVGASVFVETTGTKEATLIDRFVNLSNSNGMNRLRFRSFDKVTDEADFVWDAALTGKMTINLGDRSENAIVMDPEATKLSPLYLSAGVHSGLSFSNLGNSSISFEGVDPAHFNLATKSFDLLGGKDPDNDVFCFTPCQMCSEETWNEIRVLGQPCSLEKAATTQCSQSARVHVTQNTVPALLSVSCGKPKWDPNADSAGECAIGYNAYGAEGEFTNVIPTASKIIAAILTVSAAAATVIGASVLISRMTLAIGKTVLPSVNRWWLSNMMRDFFNDQFSWASIVLTACLGGVTNYDISNWGGPVDGLVLEVKNVLFDWLYFCETVYQPIVIITWVMSVAVVVLRVLTLVCARKNTQGWLNVLRVLDPIHAVVSSVSLLLLPFAGYAVPVLMSLKAGVGIATLLSALAIIASVPVGSFSAVTRVRVIASYIGISLPFLMSIVSGLGASRGVLLSLLLICVIVLPLCNTFVLWKLFFAGADTRTKAWKQSLFWTFGLRAASLICGLVFFSTLFFNLNAVASGFAYAFWIFWIVLPPLQLIPLIATTKYSNIVPRNYRSSGYYTPINTDEVTPLRDGSVAASLNSITNIPSGKDMSDIAAA